MRHGLIIGKFLPPHRGHALLIERAADQCDRLTVLVMGTQWPVFPAEARAQWLRDHAAERGLGEVEIFGLLDDAPVDYDSEVAWIAHSEIIRRALSARGLPPVDAVFSSEPYGARLAAELSAEAVVVDLDRAAVPLCATQIRGDLAGQWQNVIPPARRGLAVRVVVVGAESTGTTTLCRALVEHYAERFPGLEFVPEWGREYTYLKHAELAAARPDATVEDIVWTPEDFEAIAREQNRLEDAAAERLPLVIADTDAWATTLWERRYLGNDSHASDDEGARVGPRSVYLVTDHTGVPFEDDGWRDGEHRRAEMTEWFLEGLARSDHSWVLLRGSREERLAYAVKIVDSLLGKRLDMGSWGL